MRTIKQIRGAGPAQRRAWFERRHVIGRAARHYERAAALLVAGCVYTARVVRTPLTLRGAGVGELPAVAPPGAREGVPPGAVPGAMPAAGAWVTATAPARVDLAGGWSDTPPVTFDATATAAEAALMAGAGHSDGGGGGGAVADVAACARAGGGLVVNAAVLVDGARPIGARARRIARRVVIVRERGAGGSPQPCDDGVPPPIITFECELASLADFEDFDRPSAKVRICLGGIT